jgi:hypothetical protein
MSSFSTIQPCIGSMHKHCPSPPTHMRTFPTLYTRTHALTRMHTHTHAHTHTHTCMHTHTCTCSLVMGMSTASTCPPAPGPVVSLKIILRVPSAAACTATSSSPPSMVAMGATCNKYQRRPRNRPSSVREQKHVGYATIERRKNPAKCFNHRALSRNVWLNPFCTLLLASSSLLIHSLS